MAPQTPADNSTATAPSANGAPVQSTTPAQPAEQTGQQPNQPQYVTKADLEQAIELGVRRAQQSARDRAQNIENQVKAMSERLGTLNIPVTPELTEKIRAQAAQQLDTQLEQPSAPGPAASEPQEGNPVFDWTMEVFADEGLEIKPEDPEYKQVRAALDDPNGSMVKYQKTVLKAIEQKRERVTSEKESADARVSGGGEDSGKLLGADVNPHDLFQRAHR